MKINRYVGVVLASVLLLSMAAGCKQGDGDTNDDTNQVVPQTNPLVGTWLLTRLAVDGTDLALGNYQLILTVNADGTYVVVEDGDVADTGTWSTQGTALTLVSQGGDAIFYTYGVSGSTFTISGEEDGATVYYEFTRQ